MTNNKQGEKEMIYHNLGQSVGDRVVYLRSTDIEQMNWRRLLWSVPDEWFYLWSLGKTIVVKEITSNTNGGKIKRIFAPVFKDVIDNILFDEYPLNKNLHEHYKKAIEEIKSDPLLLRRMKFWKRKILTTDFRVEVTIVKREPNLIHKSK